MPKKKDVTPAPAPAVEREPASKSAPPKTSWDPKTNRVIHHRDEG